MTDVFRALADPNRRKLLDKLRAQNGQTLHELCDGIAMSRQAVSKHLTVLRQANLIAVHRSGREAHHFLNPVPLAQIMRRWVSSFEDMPLVTLDDSAKPRGHRSRSCSYARRSGSIEPDRRV